MRANILLFIDRDNVMEQLDEVVGKDEARGSKKRNLSDWDGFQGPENEWSGWCGSLVLAGGSESGFEVLAPEIMSQGQGR
jgi:hypothetical protein